MHRIEKTVSSREETELPGDGGWVRLIYLGILPFCVWGSIQVLPMKKNPKTKEYRDNAECWRANLKSVGRSGHL